MFRVKQFQSKLEKSRMICNIQEYIKTFLICLDYYIKMQIISKQSNIFASAEELLKALWNIIKYSKIFKEL